MKILLNTKVLLFTVFISLITISCADNFVDTTPTDNLPGESIIVDLASAESALNGMYSGLQVDGVYGGYETFITGLYSDELEHTGSFPSFAQFEGNDPTANNTTLTNTWNQHYSALYGANLIINNVGNPSIGISQTDQDRIIGQALATRALINYKLVKAWGAIPLINNAYTTSTEIDKNPIPRSAVNDVYKSIMTDITEAVNRLPEGLNFYFFNKNAARVLKAKVEMELGLYQDAENTLKPVLTAGYDLESDYSNLFGKVGGSGLTASSIETIFAIDFNETDGSNHAFFYRDAGRGEVGPSQILINAFETNDLRKNLIDSNNDIVKYTDAGNGDDDAYVFRYADVLLMQAELLARKDDPTASDFINRVRTRAKLGPVTINSTNVVDLIAQERFVEFYAESSDRYFTITRLGIADAVVKSKPSSVFIAARNNLWPIPQAEIERNSAISASDQNPGY